MASFDRDFKEKAKVSPGNGDVIFIYDAPKHEFGIAIKTQNELGSFNDVIQIPSLEIQEFKPVDSTPTVEEKVCDIVAVNRWRHAGDQDWITLAQGEIDDATLMSWGYGEKTHQFNACSSAPTDALKVYRWHHPSQNDWVSLSELANHNQLKSWGYEGGFFQFYGFKNKPEDGVAVNRWYHKVQQDWVLLAEDEASDATLKSWGYSEKTFVFYALKK